MKSVIRKVYVALKSYWKEDKAKFERSQAVKSNSLERVFRL